MAAGRQPRNGTAMAGSLQASLPPRMRLTRQAVRNHRAAAEQLAGMQVRATVLAHGCALQQSTGADMRKLAQIENGIVVNVIVAPGLLSEEEITDRLQKRQAALMQVKNEDETAYYSEVQITQFLADLEAELRADPWADLPEAGAAGIGWAYDAATGEFTPPEPVERFADLSRRQFEFMLALTGFGDVWNALAEGAKAAGDMVTYASLVAERAGSKFRHDVTLATVAKFRAAAAQIAPDTDLSDEAISASWKLAEKFKGAGG